MVSFSGWENFYVIVGSSAGALIGLQFVVLTLIAERPPLRAEEAGAAFATPTIVHFGAVLLLSAIVSAPWDGIPVVALLWGILGFGGAGYAVIIARRMRRQTTYRPEFEDWLLHLLLPFAAYTILALSALAAFSLARQALFGVGAAALLLLFAGIHNAWDAVTYHLLVKQERQREGKQGKCNHLFAAINATSSENSPACFSEIISPKVRTDPVSRGLWF